MSLGTRILTLLACLLVLGTVLTGALSLFLLNRSLLDAVDEDLRTATPALLRLSAQISEQTAAGQPRQTTYVPVDFAVEIRDADGKAVLRSINIHAADGSTMQLPALSEQELEQVNGVPFTVTDSSGERWRLLATRTADPAGGSVLIALPLSGVDATMREMGLVIMLVGTVVVVLGVAAGTWMVRRALGPLRDAESTASAIAAGDLSRRVPVTNTSLEVHSLGLAMNEMLIHIEDALTARAASEQRAMHSEAKMRRFVGDASHELRTPLAAIRGFGELYRMGALRTEDDVASAMRRIEDEARRMGSLVDDLLRLARIDENPDLELAPLDLSDALFDAAQDLRALDPSRQVQVVDLAGTPLPHRRVVPVMGHEPSLRQVILNLVGNANRHTPKGSPVEIAVGPSAQDGPPMLVLEVRDHGPGIAEDARERVFERFYRTDASRQRAAQGGGAGLGLSIAASIVGQHHGRIEVCESSGGGATFRVLLPAASEKAQEAITPSMPDQTRPIGRGSRPQG